MKFYEKTTRKQGRPKKNRPKAEANELTTYRQPSMKMCLPFDTPMTIVSSSLQDDRHMNPISPLVPATTSAAEVNTEIGLSLKKGGEDTKKRKRRGRPSKAKDNSLVPVVNKLGDLTQKKDQRPSHTGIKKKPQRTRRASDQSSIGLQTEIYRRTTHRRRQAPNRLGIEPQHESEKGSNFSEKLIAQESDKELSFGCNEKVKRNFFPSHLRLNFESIKRIISTLLIFMCIVNYAYGLPTYVNTNLINGMTLSKSTMEPCPTTPQQFPANDTDPQVPTRELNCKSNQLFFQSIPTSLITDPIWTYPTLPAEHIDTSLTLTTLKEGEFKTVVLFLFFVILLYTAVIGYFESSFIC